jgi:hypothetical protein
LQSFLPKFAIIDTAKHNDNKRPRELCAEVGAGEIVLFEKAYVDFEHLHARTREGRLTDVPENVGRVVMCGHERASSGHQVALKWPQRENGGKKSDSVSEDGTEDCDPESMAVLRVAIELFSVVKFPVLRENTGKSTVSSPLPGALFHLNRP